MNEPTKKVKTEAMTFRIDPATKQAVEAVAKESSRTAAGQILHFCKQGLARYEQEKTGA